ncbi:flagellar biosynthesis protein FlaG [Alteromonas mediterranea]|uniref:flagellar protein FlaG n=1 Tax=Alteromonas mediterranea TaxID=314275 RepID=UPI000903CD8C|nr:flagellar protein FlaG [Alteromonas mediterranea]APD93326.1 flagellar biosynthesis protein FlaG [Alteromonas mediterranea]APD96951.1 flagellar biosynthesis protein FlaG [Alteromonas mediterranea]QGX61020.1 flagellar biosynthesis protein FlaG [Alteromonas mediterranea]
MEIQNTQSGQAFASASTVAPVRNDSPLIAEQSSNRSEQQPRDQNQFTNSVKQIQVEATTVGEKNISQASGEQVDNKDVERNGAQLDEAVAKVESFLKVQNRELTFTIDDETKRSVVTVKDSQSGDVIRQIPSEEVLKLAERIQELQQDVGTSVGVFINNQV